MSILKPYTKRPVVAHAARLSVANTEALSREIEQAGYKVRTWSKPPMRAVSGLIIETLEGNMEAGFGDWIIKGIAGEFYPCKDEIFRASYDVEAEDNGE